MLTCCCFVRNVYKVSCFELDRLVELARQDERVYGSRMTGAGFGGCTVTLLKKEAVTETQKRIQVSRDNKRVL